MNKIITILALLIGRTPLWIPFIALIFTAKLPLGAFICFTIAIILARYFLRTHAKPKMLMRIVSFLAWVYIAIAPDGVIPMVIVLTMLYLLEILSIIKNEEMVEAKNSRNVVMSLR